MKSFTTFVLCVCMAGLTYAQKSEYVRLYQKAQKLAINQPDSAIHYAHLATKVTQQTYKQAYAHWLTGFYSQNTGYYSMAIKHYQQAYKLYNDVKQKAVILANIAFCYKNAGNHQAAIPIAIQASQRYNKLQDSTRLINSLNLLANCYYSNYKFNKADSTYHLALKIAQKQRSHKLANLYDDLARFKEHLSELDSAAYYQELALKKSKEENLATKSIRFTKLAWYYLQLQDFSRVKQYLHKAQAINHNNIKALVYFYGVQGLSLYLDKKDTLAQQVYHKYDSLLRVLRSHSNNPIQHRFTHKTAYIMYKSGHELLGKMWPKKYFAKPRQWFKKQMQHEFTLLEKTQTNIVLKDSLVVQLSNPPTHITKKVTLWWWLALTTVLAIAGWVIYHKRTQNVRAHAYFIKTIKASPIRGFAEVTSTEVNMLMEIEKRINKKLHIDDVKILIMIARNHQYNAISLHVGLNVGTIKTRIKRLKDKCGVENIRDLMAKG